MAAKRIRVGTYREFGDQLKTWRGDMSVETAVRRIQQMGVDFNGGTLRGWEYGWTARPDPVSLLALARVYKVSVDDMLDALLKARGKAHGAFKIPPASDDELEPKPTNIDGFVALPWLRRPIAAGQPLTLEPELDNDRTLAFREDRLAKMGVKDALFVSVGPREESMSPYIVPHDVVLLDQNSEKRRSPSPSQVYAVNFSALPGGETGAALKRVDVLQQGKRALLVISSENADKVKYRTEVHDLNGLNILDIVRAEVVWIGRYIGRKRG